MTSFTMNALHLFRSRIMSCRASEQWSHYGVTLAWRSPEGAGLSPASTAGRAITIRRASVLEQACGGRRPRGRSLPVPAVPRHVSRA